MVFSGWLKCCWHERSRLYFLVLFYHLEEVAARAVLEDDPEMVARLVPVVELEHVLVVQVVQDFHLDGLRATTHLVQHLLPPVLFHRLHCHVLDRLLPTPLPSQPPPTLYTTEYFPRPISS